MALRGFVISRTGVLPTDPRFLELSANEELLRYTAHWLQKREQDQVQLWGKLLGVFWTREQVDAMVNGKAKSTAPNETFIPLAYASNPDLLDGLKQTFRVHKGKFIGGGEYQPEGEEVMELGDLPMDQWLQWANKATGMMRQVSEVAKESAVTVKDGASDDPRLERIRDQIAHSKRR